MQDIKGWDRMQPKEDGLLEALTHKGGGNHKTEICCTRYILQHPFDGNAGRDVTA